MNLLEELEILLETRQPYANGNAEKCYPFVTELIRQLRAAKQSACQCGKDCIPMLGEDACVRCDLPLAHGGG